MFKMFYKITCFVIILTLEINFAYCEENIFYQNQKDFSKTIDEIEPKCVYVISTYIIKDNTGRIRGEKIVCGSGFIFDTARASGLRLITNKHIIIDEETGKEADFVRVKVNVNIPKKLALVNCKIEGIHPEYDIAILTLTNLVIEDKDIPTQEVEVNSKKIPFIRIQNQNVWEHDFIKDDTEVVEGMSLFYTGYPLGLGGMEYKSCPLTRVGIVSQVMLDNRYFIIDAHSSHGNSGSPVLGRTVSGWKIIGILQGTYPDKDPQGKLENSGLSVIISGAVIIDYINELINNKKLYDLWK